ncbi:hypothetical protein R1sor_008524 [Riccia sorocarpa]|uniref:Uncharacterized protein n=1 Tax=Riccia sorocarpa TaxID=122646 RepID=A0ABD3HTV4_9MARC
MADQSPLDEWHRLSPDQHRPPTNRSGVMANVLTYLVHHLAKRITRWKSSKIVYRLENANRTLTNSIECHLESNIGHTRTKNPPARIEKRKSRMREDQCQRMETGEAVTPVGKMDAPPSITGSPNKYKNLFILLI